LIASKFFYILFLRLQHPPLPLGAVPESQVLWQALPKLEETHQSFFSRYEFFPVHVKVRLPMPRSRGPVLGIRIRMYPHPFWSAGSGFGYSRAKITHYREELSSFEVLNVLFEG
jgi:hypothetical protein